MNYIKQTKRATAGLVIALFAMGSVACRSTLVGNVPAGADPSITFYAMVADYDNLKSRAIAFAAADSTTEETGRKVLRILQDADAALLDIGNEILLQGYPVDGWEASEFALRGFMRRLTVEGVSTGGVL